MDAVQRALSLILTQDQMDDGGLSIYTTLDPSVQNAAQDALETQLSKIEHQSNFRHPTKAEYKPPENGEGDAAMPYLEGAVVVIDNASGGIRALVGGRDYAQSKFNRALAPANRQVGSAFKPFVYAVAFSHGLLPSSAISDGPIQPGEIDGAGNWSPANSDGTYGGIMPCSYGLIHSRNTMSVRVGQFAGLDAVQKIANDLGIAQNIPHGPASYIGSFESNLKDLTSAYTVFPNAGVRRQAYIIERIDDQQHKPIYLAAHISSQALDPGSAWMTSRLMQEVLTQGTAASARSLGFKLPAAGKTGTTNDYKDAWFIGYTSTLTCGVWVGFDQPTTIVRARLRRCSGIARVDAGDEQSVAALSGRAVATHHATRTRDGLFDFQSTRHHRMHVGRNRLTTSIYQSARCRLPPARCMVVRNGHLLNRRQMGLRKRLRCRAASSNRSGDSSDANGFRTNAVNCDRQIDRQIQHARSLCEQQRTARHRTPCLKGVRRTTAAD